MNIDLKFGDAIEKMKEIPSGSVDMVLADLPYGTTESKWDIVLPFDKLWEEYLRVGKENAAFVFTASQPFTSLLIVSQINIFRHEWIWIKNAGSNFANTNREPFKEHESVVVFSRGKWTYNKQMQERTGGGVDRAKYPVKFNDQHREGTRKFEGREHHDQTELRVPSSWQKFNRERGLHPNQKPVGLMEYMIKTYTNKNEVVLDNTMGSGTTGVASVNLERSFIGIENNEKYFEVAQKRIWDSTV